MSARSVRTAAQKPAKKKITRPPLNGRQRRELRAKGHHLEPVVLVGQNGVTPGLTAAVRQALKDHELIKVKIAGEDRDDRALAAEQIAEATSAEIAQTLGRTILLFKRRDEDSKFDYLDAMA